jgi:signal transduction histidine kinase
MRAARMRRYLLPVRRIRELSWTTATDVGLVLFVTAATELGVFSVHAPLGTHIAGPRWLTVAWPLLIALPLLWRRQRALLVCALVAGGIVAQAVVSGNTPEGLQLIVLWVVVPYSVAAYSERSRALIGLAILLGAFAVYAAENTDITGGQAGNVWAGAFFLVLAGGAWLTGMVVRGRRDAAALTARANMLEREAQIASAEERSRIARELHDIVAHNLTVVVVQAAGARAQADQQRPNPSTLEKIERSGREALVEMRRLLGVLRDDDPTGPALAPHPGLAQLRSLVEHLRAACLAVELQIDGQLADLPPALDLSAYRIIQEALTNTLKHAGPEAHAWVRVRRDPGAVVLEIVDDGAGRPTVAASPEATGHGLVGMRERVALFGGELSAGARPPAGFAVSARLPLGDGRK